MRNRVGFMQLNKWRRKKNSQSRDRSINHWTSYPYCGVDEVKIRIAKLKNKKREREVKAILSEVENTAALGEENV